MAKPPTAPAENHARFEILPLGRSEEQAQSLPESVRLTVTCSPKHGPDRSVEVGGRLRAMGHQVTVHVAARMVRDGDHLDDLLDAMCEAGIDEMFLIAGDADPPAGQFSSALELLPLVDEHPRRPARIGIAGYPEGHPKISEEALQQALVDKSAHADYIATQMCFDAEALTGWVTSQREQGITLPVFIGIPGKVSRTKLVELSARIGVGPSLDFLRKQRGLRALLSRGSTSDKLYDALAPTLDEARLNIAGFHIFTFNQLTDSFEWERAKEGRKAHHSAQASSPRLYVPAEKHSQ